MRKIIEEILNLFEENGYKDVVVTKDAEEIINFATIKKNNKLNYNIIEDARSATFFCLGRINISRGPAIIIMLTDELDNSLTGITESNYQNLPLIIISIDKSDFKLNKECFKNVTKKIITEFESTDSIAKELDMYFKGMWHKPLLIQINTTNSSNKNEINNDYYKLVDCILSLCNNNSKIYVDKYLDKNDIGVQKNKNITIISRNSSYGVISKVLGHAHVNKNMHYLITSYDKIIRDINSVNMRNINNNIVIVYTKSLDIEQNLEPWFIYNNFEFRSVKSLSEIEGILTVNNNNNKPIIIEYVVREGEG